MYEWRWQYAAPALLVWLVLIAAAAGLQANRNHRILWLLLPLAIVNLLYLLLKKATGMASSSARQFDVLFQSLTIGVTLLWLVAPVIEHRRGIIRALVAFAAMLAVAALGMLSYGEADPEEKAIFLTYLGCLALALVLALAVAARSCRRVYRPVCFMTWLAVWMGVGGAVATPVTLLVLVATLSSGPSASELPQVILVAVVIGLVLGLCLYLLNLPYMLLGFASPFFRTRLQAWLNLHRPEDATLPRGTDNAPASAS